MATQVVPAPGRQRRQELAVCYSHLQIEQITVYQVRDFSLTAYQYTTLRLLNDRAKSPRARNERGLERPSAEQG